MFVRGIVGGCALWLAGCGGASLILKSPVKSQCESAGLQACEQMTEGVLQVVDGKRAQGLKTIATAAAKNSPEQLQTFADAVKALQDVPGASGYAEPLVAVATALTSVETSGETPGAPAAVAASSASSPRADWATGADLANPYPQRRRPVVIAPSPETNLAHIDGGMVRAGHVMATGPFVVTSLLRSSRSCKGIAIVLVDVLAVDRTVWAMDLDDDFPDIRVLVPRGHVMQVMGAGECGVLWFGFRPAGGGSGDELPSSP